MMKLKITLFILLSAFILTSYQQTSTPVYICTGPQSERYHKTNTCRGLSKCSTKIIKVTQEDAVKKYNRTPCKICYK